MHMSSASRVQLQFQDSDETCTRTKLRFGLNRQSTSAIPQLPVGVRPTWPESQSVNLICNFDSDSDRIVSLRAFPSTATSPTSLPTTGTLAGQSQSRASNVASPPTSYVTRSLFIHSVSLQPLEHQRAWYCCSHRDGCRTHSVRLFFPPTLFSNSKLHTFSLFCTSSCLSHRSFDSKTVPVLALYQFCRHAGHMPFRSRLLSPHFP
jgi:hypothetical protein